MWVSVSVFVSLLLLFLVTRGIWWVLLVFEFQSLLLMMGRSFWELIGYFRLFSGETPVPGFSFYAMRVVYLLQVQVPFMAHDLWESVLGLEYTGGIVCWLAGIHSTVCSFDVVQFACLCSVSVYLICLQTFFWPAGISFLESEGFSDFIIWIIVCWSGQSYCVRNPSLEILSGKCPCESRVSVCCLGEWLSAGMVWLQRWSQWQGD